MTPVIKAFCTDVGFEIANLALQCFGGHGYIREYGMEQFVRDARIAQIYEGTNGVQAMDLLGRKVPDGDGRMVRRFVSIVERDLADAAARPTLRSMVDRVRGNAEEVGAAAADYLRMFGLVATGWMWIRMAAIGDAKSGAGGIASSKVATAAYFVAKLLPDTHALASRIDAGAAPVMALDASAF
jgi:hypothetical protein